MSNYCLKVTNKDLDDGFSCDQLVEMKKVFEKKNYKCKLFDLVKTTGVSKLEPQEASVLIVRNYLNRTDEIINELEEKEEFSFSKDILETKRRLNKEIKRISKFINKVVKFEPNLVEGKFLLNEKNKYSIRGFFYYNLVGFSIGDNKLPIKWQWYKNNIKTGKPFHSVLNNGDVYIMSKKASGKDWKERAPLTLRHLEGFN